MEPTQIRVGGGMVGIRRAEKLSRIHLHGGCQMPHFVLAFAYAQASHPHLFPAPDGLVNQAPVAGYCAEILKQINDGVAALRSVMAAVTNTTDVSNTDAIASLIGVALFNGPGG